MSAETVSDVLHRIVERAGAQSPVRATESEWEAMQAAIARRDADLAARMPDDHAALSLIGDAMERLRQLGWREAVYGPKDGTVVELIELGSTGIHQGHYTGKWPTGHWWVHDAGDLWPSNPCLFRALAPAPADGAPEVEG